MSMEQDEPLGRLLATTGRWVQERCNEALNPIGASMPTFLVLKMAHEWPGISQRRLAAIIGVEGPTLSHHLDRLETDGLVRRRRGADDRRVVSVELTDEGRRQFAGAVHIMAGLDAELRGQFSPRELATLRRLLNRLRTHLMKETDVDAAG
jgi:MarR family transcriptional regulator, transcriptional regulator for hemolysin